MGFLQIVSAAGRTLVVFLQFRSDNRLQVESRIRNKGNVMEKTITKIRKFQYLKKGKGPPKKPLGGKDTHFDFFLIIKPGEGIQMQRGVTELHQRNRNYPHFLNCIQTFIKYTIIVCVWIT